MAGSECKRLVSTVTGGHGVLRMPILASVLLKPDLSYSCFMIRLPVLKDELAFLEKLLPDLQTRPDLGQLTVAIKKQIEKIREEIRAIENIETGKK